MIKLLIVDEIPLLNDVIAAVLKEEEDIHVVGTATTLADVFELAEQAEIILISTTLPNDTTLKIVRALNRELKSIKIIVIGLPESADRIIEFIEAGSANYVLRNDSTENLLKTIRETAKGRVTISPQIVARLMERVAELNEMLLDQEELINSFKLTEREREVLDFLRKKMKNKEIAAQLNIEVGTVKNHVHKILKKLNVDSRKEVTKRLNDL